MNPSTNMNIAIEMNNRGVLSLINGEDEKYALSLFADALGRMKSHVGEQMNVPLRRTFRGGKDAIDRDDAAMSSSQGAYDLSVVAVSCALLSPAHHDHIFNRTISICPCHNHGGPDFIPIYSACILLNMAIVYHRVAIKFGHALFLEKAERLYDMTVRALIPTHEDSTSVAIRTIAFNNLADTHLRQGRFDATDRDIRHLSYLIHQRKNISTRGGPAAAASESAILADSDIDSMILNLLLWTVPQAAAAA